ncbi:MAG: carboxypeptidase regulatory-like domain-containing protein, partial [Anaerohalosphaera sp.]|nr:carboxypeptidase regulatory-like domain-containing protein [Anaerohalosphaera sp.]
MKNYILTLLTAILILQTSQLFAEEIDCIVTVVDTEGRPIKDAEVTVRGQDYNFANGKLIVEQLGRAAATNVNGNCRVRFELDVRETAIFVFAHKDGFTAGWKGISRFARILEIRIVLDRVNSTGGIVTDENNKPIVGAKVTAYPKDSAMMEITETQSHLRWPDSIFTTTTDHEGRFNFDCLASWTTVSFSAEFPGRAYTHTSYGLECEKLADYKACCKDIHITMHPAGRIKGKVISTRGGNIKGLKLIATGEIIRFGNRYTASSDNNGKFTFSDLPPDTYMVTAATLNGDLTQQLTVGARIEIKTGQTVDNIKLRMRNPITLNVIVKNAKTNEPVRNASVNINQKNLSIVSHLTYTTTTDNRGVAKILSLPGKCHICITHNDYDYSGREYLIRSSDTNLVAQFQPKSIVNGQAVYEDGTVAAGVEVSVTALNPEYKLTDRNGRFSIKYSEQMTQKRFAIARDMKSGLAGVVDITENKGPVKIVLTEAATLKGRVTDQDNRPIKMARVQVLCKKPLGNHLYTDEDGKFELQAVPYAQKYLNHRISVLANGYSLVNRNKIEIEKDMGEIIELPDIVLKAANMTLSGVAKYEDGSVAAHKGVALSEIYHIFGQPNLHSVTDSEGKFHFEGACEGWLRIQCGFSWAGNNGFIDAKGGDNITVIMNSNPTVHRIHTTTDNLQGNKIPMYETLTNGIDAEELENKKLLICF